MAITGTDRGTGTHNSSALSFTLAPASNLAAGSWAALVIACDNADTSGAAHSTFTVTDTLGNTWTRRISPLYDPGAASAGVEGAIFTTPQNGGTLTTGATITVTFDANTTAKAWALHEVVPTAGKEITYVTGGVNTGAATGSPTVTTGSITSGNMVIGGGFAENTDSWAGDADATNGSWSTHQHTGVGSTTSAISVTSQRKVVTATATQTYNPTRTSSDCILGYIVLSEFTPPIEASVGEGFATVSAQDGVAAFQSAASETVATTTAESVAWAGDAAATETASTTDAATGALDTSQAVAETLATVDAPAATADWSSAAAETVAVVDAATVPAGGIVAVTLPRILAPRRQPQGRVSVDWANPLTRGLRFACIPALTHPSGNRNLVTGIGDDTATSAREKNVAVTSQGIAMRVASATTGAIFSGVRLPVEGKATVLILRRRVGGTQIKNIFSVTVTSTQIVCAIRATATNRYLAFASYDNVTNNITTSTVVDSVQTRLSDVAVVGVRVNGTAIELIREGEKYSATHADDLASMVALYPTAKICIGGLRGASDVVSSADQDQYTYGVYYWDRVLSDAEIAAIRADFWQLLKPAAPEHYWFGSAAGTTHNATAAESAALSSAKSATQEIAAAASESVGTTSAQETTHDSTSTAAESVALTSAEAATWAGDAALTLTLAVSTAEAGGLDSAGTVAETAAVATAQAQDGATVLTVGETTGLASSEALTATWETTATFATAITDAGAAVATIEAAASETAALTTAQAQDGDAVMTLAESTGLTGSEAVTHSAQVTLAESVATQSAESVAQAFVAAVAEALATVTAQAAGTTLEAALAETVGTTATITATATLDGTVVFALGASELASATADQFAAVTFTAALSDALVAGLASTLGVSESAVLIESIDGQVFQAVIGLPDGRTLVVRVDNRVLAVPAENRTLQVAAERRTLTVEEEQRTFRVPPAPRSFTVH